MKPVERDDYGEMICDKIRGGEPVGVIEAMAAINYHDQREAWLRYNRWWRRAWRWVTYNKRSTP